MAKQPLNKTKPKHTAKEVEITSSKNGPVKKEGLIKRMILFPFRWAMKKAISFIAFVLILAGIIFLLWSKFPNFPSTILSILLPTPTTVIQEEIPLREEQVVYMRFYGKRMELDGNECRMGELPNHIHELRKKYKDKDIIVYYKSTPDDPYEQAEEFIQALEGHHLKVARE